MASARDFNLRQGAATRCNADGHREGSVTPGGFQARCLTSWGVT